MREQLIKAMQRNHLINMIYVSKNGSVTKRRVKVIKIVGDSFQAFCFTRNSKRTFIINNVLAIVPFVPKECGVV